MDYVIREAVMSDLEDLIKLYDCLSDETEKTMPDERAVKVLGDMIKSRFVYLLVSVCGETVASTLSVAVIPSLTHGKRPYAVVEHVVTHPDFRGNGMAVALLKQAEEKARTFNCYKIMLITGRKEENVHRLYRRSGFSDCGKTAYVKLLDNQLRIK